MNHWNVFVLEHRVGSKFRWKTFEGAVKMNLLKQVAGYVKAPATTILPNFLPCGRGELYRHPIRLNRTNTPRMYLEEFQDKHRVLT